ncbi:MAG: DUF2779 domain-containing protein [bacterium]
MSKTLPEKRLSKSRILSGLQCEKRLWLELHQPKLAVVSAQAELRFAVGNEVGEVAQSLHPGGHLIGFDDGIVGALVETERVMRESPRATLFEATFEHQGVVVRVDVLAPGARGFRLIEVKSSTSVKQPHYPDCAVQSWVLEGCGLAVAQVELAHIDNRFVYRGDGDYRGLLHYEDLSRAVAEIKQEVPEWVRGFNAVMNGEQPDIETGAHCTTPYDCPFIEHCAGPSADYPVDCLPYGRGVAQALHDEGVHDIRDIPHGRLHNDQHEWIRRVTINGESELRPAASEFLRDLSYPRCYLDFETIALAVPIWRGARPYQTLPFQWSCHVESRAGEIVHREFLAAADTEVTPMRAFIESLLTAVGDAGPIFVYSAFESRCLRDLAERFDDLADDIDAVIERLVDLLPLTRAHYYHPDMRGSWSLKNVLPTIAAMDYSDLGEVQGGEAAGAAYREMLRAAADTDTDAKRARTLTRDLLAYCKRDTEALVALAHFLSSGKRIDCTKSGMKNPK